MPIFAEFIENYLGIELAEWQRKLIEKECGEMGEKFDELKRKARTNPTIKEYLDGSKTHLIADPSLGGVLREFTEVDRKAKVGDYVIRDGVIRKVTKRSEITDGVEFEGFIDYDGEETIGWGDGSYKMLEPTDIVQIDGKRYCMVERKAEVGEKVIIVKAENTYGKYRNGSVIYVEDVTVYGIYNDDVRADDDNVYGIIGHGEYRVLEPVERVEPVLSTSDLIANLAKRVVELERRLSDINVDVNEANERIDRLASTCEQSATSIARDVERIDAEVERLKKELSDKPSQAVTLTLDSAVLAKLIERGLGE